jgi:hypothetical protein
MGKHSAVTKRFTVFEYRYYQRRAVAVWIKLRRAVKARLNRG